MQIKKQTKGTVYVAMSGGVDSSVAALLLKRAGWGVVGVYMKPWQPKGMTCLWQSERADALRVAAALDIPLKTWDFSREYRKLVAAPMIHAYRTGTTPNPDVECNRHIKFGLFYERALKEGANAVATGHYANIRRGTNNELRITNAKDKEKDQTYFLWGLQARQLGRILFPVGRLLKKDVRTLATGAGLMTAGKKDSQGVCFVGDLDMKSFLSSAIKPKPGRILHVDGRDLGAHDGAAYYTIGQRHGLDIKEGGGPYFVVKKDMHTNTITVGGERDLYASRARVTGIHWIGSKPTADVPLQAKIRYRTEAVAAVLRGSMLTFRRPVRAVAPGQSVVFYRGSVVLGGAILA